MTYVNNVDNKLVLFNPTNNTIFPNSIPKKRRFFTHQLSCQSQGILLFQNPVFKVMKNPCGILFGDFLKFLDSNIAQDDLPGTSFHHRGLKSFWLPQVYSVCHCLFQEQPWQEGSLLDRPKTVQGLFWRNSFWIGWWIQPICSICFLIHEVSGCLTY